MKFSRSDRPFADRIIAAIIWTMVKMMNQNVVPRSSIQSPISSAP